MPMRISPNIDTDSARITNTPTRIGQITNSVLPITQSDILEILQREQDHAAALLSLSPLLSSLFVSYANRAAAFESASSTPSPDSEEREALQDAVVALREENEKLRLENLEMAGKLEAAAASQEAFRSQVSSLKEINMTQQVDIKALQTELIGSKDERDRLVLDSNAEKAAFQVQLSNLEARREELKETVVEQQVKISKLERHGLSCPPNIPAAAGPIETEERAEQEAKEQAEKAAREKAGEVAKRRSEREAAEKTEREEKEKAEEASRTKAIRLKAGKEAKERAERETKEKEDRERREKIEEEERAEREVKEKTEREAKEREERRKAAPFKTPSSAKPAPSFGRTSTEPPAVGSWFKSFADV